MAEKGTNLHHHFWTRRDWTERRIDKLVRDHPLSKSIMDIRIHSELHRHVEPVKPPVEREMSSRVFRMLQDAKTSYTPLDAAKMMADAGIPVQAKLQGAPIVVVRAVISFLLDCTPISTLSESFNS